MNENDSVWLFQGDNATFPSAVFNSREQAIAWIEHHGASGLLTQYPVNQSVYDWAVQYGYFTPKRDHHYSVAFQQNFTSAYQPHSHFKAVREIG